MKQKTYSLDICQETLPYEIGGVSTSDALILADLKSSIFSCSKIQNQYQNVFKKVHSSTVKNKKTVITSNTDDIKATDIIVDGTPIFRKARKIGIADKIIVDGEEVFFDNNFVYVNKKYPSITYVYGDIKTTYEQETYPVFIDESHSFLSDIISIDKKTFRTRLKNEELVLEYSDIVLDYEIGNGYVTDVQAQEGSDASIFYVNRFFIKSQFKYNYSSIVTNRKTIGSEYAKVINGKIRLNNRNIIPQSVIVNGEAINIGDIHRYSGKIDLSRSIALGTVKDGDAVLVSYQFIEFIGNNIDVSKSGINMDGRKIRVMINPTERTVGGLTIAASPTMSFVVFDNNGTISFSHNSTPMPTVTPVAAFGYSELGYSEEGFGGTINDETVSLSEIEFFETAYSDGGYGIGPFGGTIVINEQQLDDFINNNTLSAGILNIATIDLVKNIEKLELFNAQKKPSAIYNSYEWIKNESYALSTITVGNISQELSAGIFNLTIHPFVDIHIDIMSIGDNAVICADVSRIASLMAELPPASIDSEVIALFQEYQDISFDGNLDYNMLSIYVNNEQIAPLSAVMHTELAKIYFKIPHLNNKDKVGIGYGIFKPVNSVII